MRFSPLLVSGLIVEPLRYFFANYAKQNLLVWDPDDKIRTIDIGTVNDYNGIKLEDTPRILIDRGTYSIEKTGLTDNLAQSKGVKELFGASQRINMVYIRGVASIIIEARNEGTCELVADMVSHFIIWSRPLLCDTQGFNEFGMPMQVSACQPGKENVEKFQVTISVPYMMEEDWKVNQDALKLKGFFTDLTFS
jgi:hypothetical protein